MRDNSYNCLGAIFWTIAWPICCVIVWAVGRTVGRVGLDHFDRRTGTERNWNHVARGILISAQQQQYPDGEFVGLLPDSFNLRHQRRQPADINPCALVSLQKALDGEVDFLSVARDGNIVVAAPFPVTIKDGVAHVDGRVGVHYQMIVNGERIIDVDSVGEDAVPLE